MKAIVKTVAGPVRSEMFIDENQEEKHFRSCE